MKNIHILQTDKPSRFYKNEISELGFLSEKLTNTDSFCVSYNIYITSDEEIKEGDWIFDIVTKKNEIAKFNHNDLKRDWKKIILTTDQDLIKDGVQAIDDEFLEWFVKNPSCEEVEVEMNQGRYFDYGGNVHITNAYKIIIPKQETLEEVAERYSANELSQLGFINGAKWQEQETIEEVFEWLTTNNYLTDLKETLIENFKNK